MKPLNELACRFPTAVFALMLAACSPSDGGVVDARRSVDAASGGAEAVVLLTGYTGAWPSGLDPATNLTARANMSLMNAIYGGLFQLVADDDGRNARIAGVLASGYEIADEGRAIVIRLREGVTFTDGTPFDAAAVRFNIERNLASVCTCAPTGWPWADHDRVTTPDEHTVVLRFSRPYGAAMNGFPISNVNWIASPTALAAMGEEEFRIKPVGAGPFIVVSNQLSSKLVLERNPTYWQQDRPYLDRLVFQTIGSEQAAVQALLAGDAHAYEGMSSTPLIELAESNPLITVAQQPPTSPYVIQLNTSKPPFNDKRAREAIYYATNVEAIRAGLFNNRYPVSQSFTASGGLFYREEIPGYRKYDLEKARTTVAELGGMQVKLGTIRTFVSEQVATALQSQWTEAGIEVSIESYELASMIREFQSGDWRAMLQTAGSFDPESSGGVSFRFRSDQPYTGVWDERLDRLLLDAAGTIDPSARDALYFEVAKHISDNAYAPFLLAYAPAQLTAQGLVGPGLTTKIPPLLVNTGVLWQDVRLAAE